MEPFCPLYPGRKRDKQVDSFEAGNVRISIFVYGTGCVTKTPIYVAACMECVISEDKVKIDYLTGKTPVPFSIKLNGVPVPGEAIKIGGSSMVLRLSVKNMEFTVSAYHNGFGQIEWRFMSVRRGSANLSVHMGNTTVFYMEQSPDLEELYNELAHVTFDESSKRFWITHNREGFSNILYWPMGKAKWVHGPGNYGLTSEVKSYYAITGVDADGKTSAEFVEIPK